MDVLHSIAEKLHDEVKDKFTADIKARNLPVPGADEPFWRITHEGRLLFQVLISEEINPFYLRNTVKYPKDRRKEVDGKVIVGFESRDYIEPFLDYLGCAGPSFEEKFRAFLNKTNFSEEVKDFQLTRLNQGRRLSRRETSKPQENSDLIIKLNAARLSLLYAPFLVGKSFWFYFYGYDKFKGAFGPDTTNTWPLVKLLMRFKRLENDDDFSVEIDNTDDPDFHDYAGKTDFATSRDDVLVLNCRTYPSISRQLNIKIHIGSAEGEIFLGQYLNYEGDGRIISGNLVVQKIPEGLENPQPLVHHIPDLAPGDTYRQDIDGVDWGIVQYLHDKKRNFRRTPLSAGHTLDRFRNWLAYRNRLEQNPPAPPSGRAARPRGSFLEKLLSLFSRR